uniref:TrmB family transcriptional regulator n=1 Tax=Pararhizobium sp. IMCC3301 TaxID=3067904 RepID=UPI002740D76C|nr:TrmB family transcriptional regulator [Pararhizobium sp. IMCC3301]
MQTSLTTAKSKEGDATLLDNLARLGFTAPEARTYEALIQVQPATAYELAKTSGLARANSYNSVTNLVLKGAIQPVSSHPVRYAITSPQHFFASIADEVQHTASQIQDQVLRTYAPMGSDFVEVSEGRLAVEDKVRSLIARAKTDLHFKVSDQLIKPFEDAILEVMKRGVRVTIVATGEAWTTLGDAGARIVPHEGSGSAPSRANDVAMTVVADAAASFVGTMKPLYRGYSAENPTLVYVIQTMILHEIYLSEIVTAIGLDRLAELGLSFDALRGKYRPEQHGQRMAENP